MNLQTSSHSAVVHTSLSSTLSQSPPEYPRTRWNVLCFDAAQRLVDLADVQYEYTASTEPAASTSILYAWSVANNVHRSLQKLLELEPGQLADKLAIENFTQQYKGRLLPTLVPAFEESLNHLKTLASDTKLHSFP